jgi:hypothetical protein
MAMRFVGITRFNLVTTRTLRHFNATAGLSLSQAKELILAPERLEASLSTFRHFCLPTYRALAERHERSHGLVLISHDLPQPYRAQLESLCASVPRLQIVEFQDDDGYDERLLPILTDLADGERLFTYRYDDDDVLATDFLDLVQELCEDLEDGTAVSLNKGFVVARLSEDTFGSFEHDLPRNAYGLGVVSSGARPVQVFGLGPHDKIAGHLIHETRTPGWVAFRHDHNDSQVNGNELDRLKKLVDSEQDASATLAALGERFPQVDAEALRSLPVLRVNENLDRLARRAIRRARRLDAELKRAKADVEADGALPRMAEDLRRTTEELRATKAALRRTRSELTRVRTRLREVSGSRSFRLARAFADTRSFTTAASLPGRLWAAGHRAAPRKMEH